MLFLMIGVLYCTTRLLVHWETQKAHVRVNSLSIQVR
jgi:hypothetical protein